MDIVTDRLLLRRLRESDAADMYRWCRNPALGDNAGWKPHASPEESLEVLRTVFLWQENVWAVELRSGGGLIGTVGLGCDPKRDNPGARMLGYWLAEPMWGRGLMGEAVDAVLRHGFSSLSLALVSAYCYPFNLRSQRLLERRGFVREGMLRAAGITYDGRCLDELCYVLVREEWQARSAHPAGFRLL